MKIVLVGPLVHVLDKEFSEYDIENEEEVIPWDLAVVIGSEPQAPIFMLRAASRMSVKGFDENAEFGGGSRSVATEARTKPCPPAFSSAYGADTGALATIMKMHV